MLPFAFDGNDSGQVNSVEDFFLFFCFLGSHEHMEKCYTFLVLLWFLCGTKRMCLLFSWIFWFESLCLSSYEKPTRCPRHIHYSVASRYTKTKPCHFMRAEKKTNKQNVPTRQEENGMNNHISYGIVCSKCLLRARGIWLRRLIICRTFSYTRTEYTVVHVHVNWLQCEYRHIADTMHSTHQSNLDPMCSFFCSLIAAVLLRTEITLFIF